MSEEGPLYEHDCDTCTFLGQFTTTFDHGLREAHTYDLYVCGVSEPTVLARASSEPSDYGSGLLFGWMWQNISTNKYGEAFRRAHKRGLIRDEVLTFMSAMYGERIYDDYEYEQLYLTGRGK